MEKNDEFQASENLLRRKKGAWKELEWAPESASICKITDESVCNIRFQRIGDRSVIGD
jgi:hypothetical protein